MEKENSNAIRDKARGMLAGLAVGDALGAPVEFGYTSQDISDLGDKVGHYQDSPMGPAGAWTDDTSMALCLADSLLECGGYDSYDIMDRFYKWMTEGYRTYDGKPAGDVGIQTMKSLTLFHRDPILHKGSKKTDSAGNGAIMRLAPVVLAGLHQSTIGWGSHKCIMEMTEFSCRETHDSDMALEVTADFASILALSFVGAPFCYMDIVTLLEHSPAYFRHGVHHEEIVQRMYLAMDSRDGEELKDKGGYILDAFTIALWGVIHSRSFEEGMLRVIQLGGDTDTNAAIYGQLAGSRYGYERIPEEWRKNVYNAEELVDLADRLLDMRCQVIRTRFEDDKDFEDINTGERPNGSKRNYDDPISIADLLKRNKNTKT